MLEKRKILQGLVVALVATAALFAMQSCASSSGYHTKPPAGNHFKCK